MLLVLVPFVSAQTVYPPETKAIPIPKMEDLPLADGPFKGTVEALKQSAGLHTLEISPKSADTWKAINVRSVVLKPSL